MHICFLIYGSGNNWALGWIFPLKTSEKNKLKYKAHSCSNTTYVIFNFAFITILITAASRQPHLKCWSSIDILKAQGVFWCDSRCVGSALMLSASYSCVAPCQDVNGSQTHASVSLRHRLMTDPLPSALSGGLFIKWEIIQSQSRQVLFLWRW